jgi:hypothetical protein
MKILPQPTRQAIGNNLRVHPLRRMAVTGLVPGGGTLFTDRIWPPLTDPRGQPGGVETYSRIPHAHIH